MSGSTLEHVSVTVRSFIVELSVFSAKYQTLMIRLSTQITTWNPMFADS